MAATAVIEMIAECKLRRRQLADDGNMAITGRDLRERTQQLGHLFQSTGVGR
jgi:hypothetical protein